MLVEAGRTRQERIGKFCVLELLLHTRRPGTTAARLAHRIQSGFPSKSGRSRQAAVGRSTSLSPDRPASRPKTPDPKGELPCRRWRRSRSPTSHANETARRPESFVINLDAQSSSPSEERNALSEGRREEGKIKFRQIKRSNALNFCAVGDLVFGGFAVEDRIVRYGDRFHGLWRPAIGAESSPLEFSYRSPLTLAAH